MKRDRRSRTDTEWLGLRQVTEYAAVSERTVRAWIHSPVDALPAVRVGGKVLVRRSFLDAWLGNTGWQPRALWVTYLVVWLPTLIALLMSMWMARS